MELAEERRLRESAERLANWQRWGPYLAERQWATVREDYSKSGDCWNYFPHDHARSRAYRWGEDGLLGITDRQCRLCFALGLWNERDPILKERLFGLTGPEGNHGEDVKECYYYLDSSPTHSYLKALYKYPQAAFPYNQLVEENARRGKQDREFELIDTGVFADNRYFDVFIEYAKDSPNDILIKITVFNRSSEIAPLHILPTLWFRNNWSWGSVHDRISEKPIIKRSGPMAVKAEHPTLGSFHMLCDQVASGALLFTDNETNTERLFGVPSDTYTKDAFHRYVIDGEVDAVNPKNEGTKAAVHLITELAGKGSLTLKFRLHAEAETPAQCFGPPFEQVFERRRQETDAFFSKLLPATMATDAARVARQAYAGLLWSKQFYHYVIKDWQQGDGSQADSEREEVRNDGWRHLYCRDILSMPDKWEYPWFAAWDLAFQTIPLAKIDPELAKSQLLLLLREWYMHPDGQIPAYEFAFSDVNPPVHAWACWQVYNSANPQGERDRVFLEKAFLKLLLNFTWWVNRKDVHGNHLFAGGFLGLDNIGVFDRSSPLPNGGQLEQADGTAWMAFYCISMLSMALELAREDPAYGDMASKFFEHFIAIVDAMNAFGGTGLWDDDDGFYYDWLSLDGSSVPLRTRSIAGLIPLLAVEVLDNRVIDSLPGFKKRLEWFLTNRHDLSHYVSYMSCTCPNARHHGRRLLAVPSEERLRLVLVHLLDESEFLSPHGIRSMSKFHLTNPYKFTIGSEDYQVGYEPAESQSTLFGGNSNWRGPVWFPLNYLLIKALEKYHDYFGNSFKIEFPTGSGHALTLLEVSHLLCHRLTTLFLKDKDGKRPIHGAEDAQYLDQHWEDLFLFHEYFDGDNGRGCGACHQTGWTALVTQSLEACALRHQKNGGSNTDEKCGCCDDGDCVDDCAPTN